MDSCQSPSSDSEAEAMAAEIDLIDSQNVNCENGEKAGDSWCFLYEALNGVNLLRLFLHGPKMPVSPRLDSLRAFLSTSLRSSSPVVVCEWKVPEGGTYAISVPMPFCLVDHSVPFRAVAAVDHIEVRIKLLPQTREFLENSILVPARSKARGAGEESMDGIEPGDSWRSTLSLATDTDKLNRKQGVSFYCKYCMSKVNSRDIRLFQALPSLDWLENVENWFGGCCGHNAAETWSKVHQFEQQLTPKPGLCLVGTTICILHRDDLIPNYIDELKQLLSDDNFLVDKLDDQISDDGNASSSRQSNEMSTSGRNTETPSDAGSKEKGVHFPRDQCTAIRENSKAERLVDALENSSVSTLRKDARASSAGSVSEESKHLTSPTQTAQAGLSESTCCNAHAASGQSNEGNRSQVTSTARAPANGFMSASSHNARSLSWTPFPCRMCSRPLGATSGEDEDGIQLFKCEISSDANRSSDIFRNHTLERLFTNEMFAGAEENSSYRYIIRDLSAKWPVMHLILMNPDSWVCTSFCRGTLRFPSEDSNGAHPDLLQSGGLGSEQGKESKEDLESDRLTGVCFEPCVQVMYRCTFSPSSFKEEDRDAEDWTRDSQAETMYMFPTEVQSLLAVLLVNERLFPASCQGFPNYKVSFLSR